MLPHIHRNLAQEKRWPREINSRDMSPLNVLAICGSLRAQSINHMLLRAVAQLAPERMSISLYNGMRGLPLFNPDLEADMPTVVQQLRDAVTNSDAVIIASPEYAHGVSGVMKNALDWLVSDERFLGKPVALLSSSPHSRHADAALRETLVTMSARIVDSASVAVQVRGTGMNENDILRHVEISTALRTALIALEVAVGSGSSHAPTR